MLVILRAAPGDVVFSSQPVERRAPRPCPGHFGSNWQKRIVASILADMKRVTPVIVKGAIIECKVRGLVKIVGLSDAPLPWPIGERDGQRSLIVYRGLAKAIREEDPVSVASAWGVSIEQIKAWREALATSENRHERIAPALKGKPLPNYREPRVIFQLEPQSPPDPDDERVKILLPIAIVETPPRVKASKWQLKRSQRVKPLEPRKPDKRRRLWQPSEDEMVRTLPAIAVALALGMSENSIYQRRKRLGVGLHQQLQNRS
jgi:hypothetical protein